MASLYELLCHHSLTNTDPLLGELLSYLPTRFHLHFFEYISDEILITDQLIYSTLLFLFLIPMIQLTFRKSIFYGHPTLKKAADRERPATGARTRGPRWPESHQPRRAAPAAPAFQLPSKQETVGATA